jgi:transglutaminase superfamily protein
MRRLVKFWHLTWREKQFLCEAALLLSAAKVCVTTIGFKHIDRFLRAHWDDRTQGAVDPEQEIRLVQHSISRAANILWWKSLCLSRSIAEFVMLRRRGIPAVMFAGVRFSGRSTLEAHAWVGTGLEFKDKNDKSCGNSDFLPVIRIGTGSADR